MKILCQTAILNLSNAQVVHSNGENATFASVAAEAILSTPPDPEDTDGEKCYDDYKLAKKLLGSKSISLSKADAARVRSAVGSSKSLNKIVIGRMFDILDGKAKDGDLES